MGFEVKLEAVSKRYEADGEAVVALGEVDLHVDPGAMLAVMGPSGSGKSTLLHVVGAMDRPDSGTVQVDRFTVTALSRSEQAAYRRRIGFVFQRFHLLPALTVLDNVVAPVLPFRTGFDKFERGRSLLASVGLADRERSLPSKLSGGEQQRVAIARALIGEPGLLLADEPTGNLDSVTGADIVQLISDLRTEKDMTVIVATHDPIIASTCERVVTMRDGRVLDHMAIPATEAKDEQDTLRGIGRLDGSG
ncbi:MAG: ABC transporter ATP-binding protein [Actinobacteria bacterium]|nr:MAG: ABC transporter ATP-binding protein [Actinomycetota bacterium]